MRGTPTTYYQSLNKQFLIAGVEKKLFFLIAALTTPFAAAGHFTSWRLNVTTVVLFALVYSVGVVITRIDPQMFEIYKRHIRYNTYYHPLSRVGAKLGRIKPSVPNISGKTGLF